MIRKLTIVIEVPPELNFEQLRDWFAKNPQLHVTGQAGCSEHGTLTLALSTSAGPRVLKGDALTCYLECVAALWPDKEVKTTGPGIRGGGRH